MRHDAHAPFPATRGSLSPARAQFAAPPQLSPREIECLALVASGLTDEDAGQRLGITRSAVRFHIKNICRKLQAPNRCAAVYRAARRRII